MKTIGYFLILAFNGGEGGGSPLDVNPGLILWTVVTFICLLLILKKIAWKPILNTLNERENLIKESLDKAETARLEAEKLILENKSNVLKAEEEGQKVIEQSREYAEKVKSQVLEESKIQAKKIILGNDSEFKWRKSNKHEVIVLPYSDIHELPDSWTPPDDIFAFGNKELDKLSPVDRENLEMFHADFKKDWNKNKEPQLGNLVLELLKKHASGNETGISTKVDLKGEIEIKREERVLANVREELGRGYSR